MELWFKIYIKQIGQDVTYLKIPTLTNGIKQTKTNYVYLKILEGKERFNKIIGFSRNLTKLTYFKKGFKE